jgi:hypothetical protein
LTIYFGASFVNDAADRVGMYDDDDNDSERSGNQSCDSCFHKDSNELFGDVGGTMGDRCDTTGGTAEEAMLDGVDDDNNNNAV